MKNKIKDSWEKIDMDPNSKREVLSRVLDTQERKSTFPVKYIIAVATVILVCISSSFLFFQTEKNNLSNQTNTFSEKEEIQGYSKTEERVARSLPDALEKTLIPLEQSMQEKSYYNGPACVQMVLRLHGIEKSQDELANELCTSSITGSEYADIQRVVNKYCFGSEYIQDDQAGYHLALGYDLSRLESRIRMDMASNDPVFIALDGNTLYEGASKGNHLVLIVGYVMNTKEDTIVYYYFIDPWDKNRDDKYGGLKTITPEDLQAAYMNNQEPAYIW